MATIVLIRAGQTTYDEQSRLLGNLDMPLSAEGVDQVDGIINELQLHDLNLQAIIASPTDPATSTARAISAAFGDVKIKEPEELRNVDQGLWQGLAEEEVRHRYPRVFRQGKEKPHAICPPEGESLSEAARRLQKVLNKAIRKYDVFAIVVPDPLATVIRCTVQQRCPEVNDCLCGETEQRAVQVLKASQFEPDDFVNAVQKTEETRQQQEAAS